MDRLKNKIAVVTGGESGIGRAIVELFIREGAKVCIFDINGSGENFYHTDVADEENVIESFKAVVNRYGVIDILVNNAGVTGENKSTDQLSEKEWEEVFAINVKGVFLCTKTVLPYMIKNRKGSIINMASVYATYGTRGDFSAYHAAKGAVSAMTKQDAVTYGKYGIRVNGIFPGLIATPMIKKFAQTFDGGYESYEKYAAKRHPIGCLGEPDDVAYGALYLASDESKFVTGTHLYIDGGYTAW